MSTAVLELAPNTHLQELLDATIGVLGGLQVLESCCYGPAELIEAAAIDLGAQMDELSRLGPNSGRPSLTEIELLTDDAGRQICAQIRLNVQRITAETSGLSLELRKMLADTRDAIAIATGSTGMYDALGRTTSGQLRRPRGTM